jgi:uncharacterized protein YndB with AHSA1/START domain
MTPQAAQTTQNDTAVRKSISVRAGVERAFEAFTAGMDSWWPREHHIGKSPMTKSVLQCRAGGRCYSEHADGSESDWGLVTVWEPPRRFVLAWLINANWQYDADLSRTSEVEIRFTPQADGTTRVDLEHRNFERMGESGNNMRMMVDAPGGWSGLLQRYAGFVDQAVEKGESQ